MESSTFGVGPPRWKKKRQPRNSCGCMLCGSGTRSSPKVLQHRKGNFRRYVGAPARNFFDGRQPAAAVGCTSTLQIFPKSGPTPNREYSAKSARLGRTSDPKIGTFRIKCHPSRHLRPQIVNIPLKVSPLASRLTPNREHSAHSATLSASLAPFHEHSAKSATPRDYFK